jgi:hypothetical protein
MIVMATACDRCLATSLQPTIRQNRGAIVTTMGNAARTRTPDGLGLGLNITLRVAELHHLDLRFGPSEYGGLQVDLVGPLRHEPNATPNLR